RAGPVEVPVPSAAFELERVAAHDLRHLAAALRAGVGRGVGRLLQALDDVAARLADELVDRHDREDIHKTERASSPDHAGVERDNRSRRTRASAGPIRSSRRSACTGSFERLAFSQTRPARWTAPL